MTQLYEVEQYKDGIFKGTMAGCGRNKGTWDTTGSRRACQRWAKELKDRKDGYQYVVKPQFG